MDKCKRSSAVLNGNEKFDLTWVAKEMIPGKWYNIKDDEQLKEWMRQIDYRFGYPKFTLSLSPDYKQVRKTEL